MFVKEGVDLTKMKGIEGTFSSDLSGAVIRLEVPGNGKVDVYYVDVEKDDTDEVSITSMNLNTSEPEEIIAEGKYVGMDLHNVSDREAGPSYLAFNTGKSVYILHISDDKTWNIEEWKGRSDDE